ncbi:hypothetical protein [Rhizobium sp. No.120]
MAGFCSVSDAVDHSAMTRRLWSDDQPDNRQTLIEPLVAYAVQGVCA